MSSGGARRIRKWLWELRRDRTFGQGPRAQEEQLGKSLLERYKGHAHLGAAFTLGLEGLQHVLSSVTVMLNTYVPCLMLQMELL